MNYVNPYHDSISTVQLSPFAEEQWNRIVTYSPIYVHWTDMVMMPRRRPTKSAGGKLNTLDQIDLNTMKLEDEILLNELYQIRRTAAAPTRENARNHPSVVLTEEPDQQTFSSDSFPEAKESIKHNCSYVETSSVQQPISSKRLVMTNQVWKRSLSAAFPLEFLWIDRPNLFLSRKLHQRMVMNKTVNFLK